MSADESADESADDAPRDRRAAPLLRRPVHRDRLPWAACAAHLAAAAMFFALKDRPPPGVAVAAFVVLGMLVVPAVLAAGIAARWALRLAAVRRAGHRRAAGRSGRIPAARRAPVAETAAEAATGARDAPPRARHDRV